MAVQSGPPDGGTPQDAGVTDQASGSPDVNANTPAFTKGPKLVFIDGLVTGTTSVAGLTLDDVRLCIGFGGGSFSTLHAVPDDVAMPLANYPGVRRGSGVDLGQFNGGTLTIDVFSASELSADSAWAPPSVRSDYTCTQIDCTGAFPCRPHVSLQIALEQGRVNVIGLVDKTKDPGLVQRAFDDTVFSGTPGSLWGTVTDVSGWQSGGTRNVFYGSLTTSETTDTPLATPLDPLVATTPRELTPKITTYDGLGIRFDAVSDAGATAHFAESLDSIAFVSNATLTPPAFYDIRQNMVFALVGDPNDTTSALLNDGRNAQFDGTGLHVTAIPYTTPE